MASIKKYDSSTDPRGYLWRVQYRDPEGRSRTKQGFRTKGEATTWASTVEVSIATGEYIDPAMSKIVIADVGEKWLASQTHLKPSTSSLTATVWKTHVRPRWGSKRISTIKPSDVQAWVSTMDRSPSTVRHAHNQLAQILDAAVRDRIIRVNPARGVKFPRKRKPKQVFWTVEQLGWLADEAAKCNADYEALVWLLGTSGPRWGEAAPLRPVDLDPLRNRVQIERNAVRVGSEIIIGSPKSHEKRSAAVAGSVMKKLMKVAEGKTPNELLWPSRKGTPMGSPGKGTWFDGAMKRAMKAHPGLERVTPHGLRHVAAGLLVESGANVKAVQLQLGHASATMTLDTYAGLWDDGLDVVAKALDSAVVELSWDGPSSTDTGSSVAILR